MGTKTDEASAPAPAKSAGGWKAIADLPVDTERTVDLIVWPEGGLAPAVVKRGSVALTAGEPGITATHFLDWRPPG